MVMGATKCSLIIFIAFFNLVDSKRYGSITKVNVGINHHVEAKGYGPVCNEADDEDRAVARYDEKIKKLVKASEKFRDAPLVDLFRFFEVQNRMTKFNSCFGKTAEPHVAKMTKLKKAVKTFPMTMVQVYGNIIHKFKHDTLLKLLFPFTVKGMPSCSFSPEQLFVHLQALQPKDVKALLADKLQAKDTMLGVMFGASCNVPEFVAKSKGITKKLIQGAYDETLKLFHSSTSIEGLRRILAQAQESEDKVIKQLDKVEPTTGEVQSFTAAVAEAEKEATRNPDALLNEFEAKDSFIDLSSASEYFVDLDSGTGGVQLIKKNIAAIIVFLVFAFPLGLGLLICAAVVPDGRLWDY